MNVSRDRAGQLRVRRSVHLSITLDCDLSTLTVDAYTRCRARHLSVDTIAPHNRQSARVFGHDASREVASAVHVEGHASYRRAGRRQEEQYDFGDLLRGGDPRKRHP